MAGIAPAGGVIYGMQLPIQMLSETSRVPWELDATVEDLVTVAQRAEATGHSFVGVCDHVAIPDNDYAAHMSTTWYDTVATLGYLAAHTTSVHLLSVVWIAPYRHPLLTAKSFTTLDYLSGGRVILGVGAGHVEAEFQALGVNFHERGKLLDESIDAVRSTFGTPYASFSGTYSSFDRVGVGPQSGQELPIWVGGSGAAAWRRVGRRADGYIPMGNPIDQLPEIIATIEREAEGAGRGAHHFDIGYHAGIIYVGDPPEDAGPRSNSGSAEQIAANLRGAIDAGANTLHLRFFNRSLAELLDQMDAFGAEVAPLLT